MAAPFYYVSKDPQIIDAASIKSPQKILTVEPIHYYVKIFCAAISHRTLCGYFSLKTPHHKKHFYLILYQKTNKIVFENPYCFPRSNMKSMYLKTAYTYGKLWSGRTDQCHLLTSTPCRRWTKRKSRIFSSRLSFFKELKTVVKFQTSLQISILWKEKHI